jgi:hypothetical protein
MVIGVTIRMGQEGFDGKNDQATQRDRDLECLRANPAPARAMLDVGAIESGHTPVRFPGS